MRLGWLAVVVSACGSNGGGAVADAPRLCDCALAPDAPPIDGTPGPESNRDRMIRTYFEHLQSVPTVTMTNGLRGADLADRCAMWAAMTPSSKAVFLTITHRLDASRLDDGSSMLDHMTRMTKLNGGTGETATDAGDCGGDGNRVFLTTDAALHAALVSVADGDGGLADVGAHDPWRNTTDAAGPHDPFDASDETSDGAPRGQGHFFRDPASTVANTALGRIDLETLVDPFAFEIDQDYDCVHASNPLCDYTFYGPLCAPASTMQGLDIYTQNYGDVDPTWIPSGC